MAKTLRVKQYNPVMAMQSDDEVIAYLVDCYKEDNEGRVLVTALGYAIEALGTAKAARLLLLAGEKLVCK